MMLSGMALALMGSALQPVPFTDVRIRDAFWYPKQEINRRVSIPHTFEQCEKTGRLANFDLAAKGARSGFKGYVFDDSDVYKSLEAAAYALADRNDPQLAARTEAIIARIAAAQLQDGYLNTWYQINAPDKRFTNLRDNHELYCAGHLIEAGVAHFQATGSRTLFTVAKKSADLLCRVFGSQNGQRAGYPGHPELELAMLKLYGATGEQKYFDLAEFFLNTRGSRFFAQEHNTPMSSYDGTYWLDDAPLRRQTTIKGHAVRAAYLLAGAADLAVLKPDPELIAALDRMWQNTVFKRVFVTGGIGPSAHNEGFTVDYDLPTESAYQETCASVAMAIWNHRMGLLHGGAKYWDHVERALYNGFLSGVSLQGDRFFYVNPLASSGNHNRVEWFGCACCPPNVTRTLASLGGYAYAKSDTALYINLPIAGSVKTKVGKSVVDLNVDTEYPWNGKIVLSGSVNGAPISLYVRKPSWARSATVGPKGPKVEPGTLNGYVPLGEFRSGAKLSVEFPMPVERVAAHPAAEDLVGRIALQRGPLVYCFEGQDNGVPMDRVYVPDSSRWTASSSKMLNGVWVLKGNGMAASRPSWSKTLYQPTPTPQPIPLTAIPYFAWANRGPSPMAVWLPTAPPKGISGGLEQSATLKLSFVSGNCMPEGVRDGKAIPSSSKHPGSLCHFWPHKGTQEYVEYRWPTAQRIQALEVYWFDDTGVGEIRPPSEWWTEVRQAGKWMRISAGEYGVKLDQWNRAQFPTLSTDALRVVTQSRPGWSVGIHEIRIVEE